MAGRYLGAFMSLISITLPGLRAADVLQHHLNATRDGLYLDPLITQEAAAATHRV